MAETQARKCYDFKFKQAVVKKYAEKNSNPETARKNSGDETAAYIWGRLLFTTFHLNCGFYLKVDSMSPLIGV